MPYAKKRRAVKFRAVFLQAHEELAVTRGIVFVCKRVKERNKISFSYAKLYYFSAFFRRWT